MRPKIREILEECIETGMVSGYRRAHKHHDDPSENIVFGEIEDAIWFEIDQRFDFERNLCNELMEGFNTPIRTPDHPTKAYKVVAKDGDKVKVIRFGEQFEEHEWVELSDEDQDQIFEEWHSENKGARDLCYMVEAKLKEKNT